MERKRECEAIRAKQGDGSDETLLRVECLPVSVSHLEAFIKLQLADLIAALAVFVIGYSIAFLDWQAGFRASGVEFRCGEIWVLIIAFHFLKWFLFMD
jgi:hypothetical protein